MDDITINADFVDIAETLFDALQGIEVSQQRLQRAADWFERSPLGLDRRSFLGYLRALQRDLPPDSPLADLAARWRRKRGDSGGFSDGEAAAFLEDYQACLDPNLIFRTPITAGYARWDTAQLAAGFSFASQSELAWSLMVTDSGGAQLRGAGKDLAICPGQALLVAPGALCAIHDGPDFAEWGYYWAVFQADSRWRDWLRWPGVSPALGSVMLPDTQRDAVFAVFRSLCQCLEGEGAMEAELSHNLLEQLILRCRAALPANFRPHPDPRIERAQRFIESHYAEQFVLADVARAANLSPSRLASLFRTQCGLSVLGYRDELRMAKAAQLLRNHALGIAEVGARVGYPDPAYFSRTFNRHIGLSPRAYRHGEPAGPATGRE